MHKIGPKSMGLLGSVLLYIVTLGSHFLVAEQLVKMKGGGC